jgi:hypothetical protein
MQHNRRGTNLGVLRVVRHTGGWKFQGTFQLPAYENSRCCQCQLHAWRASWAVPAVTRLGAEVGVYQDRHHAQRLPWMREALGGFCGGRALPGMQHGKCPDIHASRIFRAWNKLKVHKGAKTKVPDAAFHRGRCALEQSQGKAQRTRVLFAWLETTARRCAMRAERWVKHCALMRATCCWALATLC